MAILTDISINILGAIVGVALSLGLPLLIRFIKYNKCKELFGKWKSTYQYYQKPSQEDRWISEDIIIDIHKSQFRFRNINNEINDSYVAYAKMVDRSSLIGEWNSILPTAHASGIFMLSILPMGGLMYGYFSGPRDTGEKIYGAWVLAKREEDLEKGKQILQMVGIKSDTDKSQPPDIEATR